MVLEAIHYDGKNLRILDQRLLPHQELWIEIIDENDAITAIKTMQVRGAPAIAIVGALGVARSLLDEKLWTNLSADEAVNWIEERLRKLLASRPTAVNLARAVNDLSTIVRSVRDEGGQSIEIKETYMKAVWKMLEDDRADNIGIGENGAKWIEQNVEAIKQGPVTMLTHCNTGSLATAGYGTALGVIRSLHNHRLLKHAFCTETRPYNQGSRLTAFELVHDQIPATLISDSMAAAFLQQKAESENVAAIVVGADRVAANGDTANKIGTYALAIAAKYHGVKFMVAAPRTTIDMATANGSLIKIEERASQELTTLTAPVMKDGAVDTKRPSETLVIAAPGIKVWNPAFDVTPLELIDAIVTEVGVAEKNVTGHFDLQRLMDMPYRNSNGLATNGHA